MAEKEATIYVVDVGSPTGRKRYGRDKSDLDWAMEYVWDKIATTVSGRRQHNILSAKVYRSLLVARPPVLA